MPKVSIILTSYNHSDYLCESISSVLNQTYSDFELIIIDDASSDDSWKIINSFEDKRIKAYKNDFQRRAIYSINNAIKNIVSGEYIAIHHSDDIWENEKIEKQVSFLESNLEIGAVFTNVKVIDQNGKQLVDKNHPYYDVFEKENRSQCQWLRYFFEFGNCLCHPSVMIRKNCFDSCGLYRFGLGQLGDFDMWVRLVLKYPIYILQEKLVKFRILDNNLNTSSLTDDSRVRISNEFYFVLKNFSKVQSKKYLFKIFPEAKNFAELKSVDNVDYCLAIIFLKLKKSMAHNLIGIDILFNFLNDSKQNLNFSSKDLIKITAEYDIFGSLLRNNLENKLLILENDKLILENEKNRLNDKVEELEENLKFTNCIKILLKNFFNSIRVGK